MENLVVLVKEYDLNGNPVITRFKNPRLCDLEHCNKHNLRVTGKPIEIVKYEKEVSY